MNLLFFHVRADEVLPRAAGYDSPLAALSLRWMLSKPNVSLR